MASTLRVHTLAKELGVPSKAVIDKCRAEGIELKNHMAAISVGLAESIREWFSSGADVTSVEMAEPVDVEVMRKSRRKTRADGDGHDEVAIATEAAGEGEPELAETSTDVDISEELAEPAETSFVAVEPVAAAEGAPLDVEPELELVEAPDAEPAEIAAEPAEPEPIAAEVSAPPAPEPQIEVPVVPSPVQQPAVRAPAVPPPPPPPAVRPAGPQVVPAPAELRGPKVVRIEAPEPTRTPRPRPAAARGPLGPSTGGATTGGVGTTTAPRRGGGGRGKGRRAEEEEAAKARSRSPRRHGTSAVDVDQRLREWRDQDLLERKERLASVTGHGLRDRRAAQRRRDATPQGGAAPAAGRPAEIAIVAPLPIKDFCAAVGVSYLTLQAKLAQVAGRMMTINQSINAEQAELLALELGIPITVERAKTAYEALEEEFAKRERPNLQPRPPVVAMLGHVDHGKTSLLDAIRKTRVASGEAGGITQHIGAYRLDRGDWHVTFVDTPGHKAFTEMRARGANLTDVVVLVVAADDGVMPQTLEAMAHAKAAGVPIVVALNKIDLPGIDLNRIYAQLAENELAPAEWGGETDLIKTSATSGRGIDDLVAHLSTLSELLDLKADATVPAQGVVIESQLREGRGVASQILIREGTLKPGQVVVCGPGAGRVRALRDDRGRQLDAAGPGTPVEVSGLDELPATGDRLYVVDSLSRAKEIAEEVRQQRRAKSLEVAPKPRTLEALLAGEAEADVPELNVIVKADVQGSVEVLKKSLAEFPADKARLNVLLAGVGAVSEADVQLARTSGAVIIGFHVVAEDRARQLADQLGVEVRSYRVIYELLDDLHKALAGLLAPIRKEEIRAAVEVRQVFNVSRVGTIAGCYVTDGTINRNHKVRLIRDGRVIVEGKSIGSLKRFKDDAREVRAGLECGIKIEDFDDVKPADVIQAYEVVEVAQEL